MARDKSEKKEKREKSRSKSSTDGVSKSSKREKHSSVSPEQGERLLQEIENGTLGANPPGPPDVEPAVNMDTDMEPNGATVDTSRIAIVRPQAALVPFANPLADEKTAKKVFKSVKKANKAKSLKRGVKEVVKALRKSPLATPSSMSSTTVPSGVVVIAADISPMDVISHLPVLCEDHGVPYVYVTSRAELGAAGQTKRPTSVVMVGKEQGKVKKAKSEKTDGAEEKEHDSKEDWADTYADLVKVVRRAGKDVRI